MVAITTDTHRPQGPVADTRHASPARLLDMPAGAASRGHATAPDAMAKVLMVVAAIVLALAVAVGTAALGRVLDTQRGIPTSSPAVASSTSSTT